MNTRITEAQLPQITEAQALSMLLQSDLWDMHKHVGWYSAPEKNFKEKGVGLIQSIIAARDAQWQAKLAEPSTPPAGERELLIDKIMEQAQVFASSWSLVGGPFDSGDLLEQSGVEKAELREMIAALAAQPEPAAQDPLQCAADWLFEAIAQCDAADIQHRLSIGYNRAERLLDAARAATKPHGWNEPGLTLTDDAIADEWLPLYTAAPAERAPAPDVAEPTEVRADGQTVLVHRWEIGIRRIVALLWGNRQEFEVDDVVEAVRKLAPEPRDDDEGLVRAVLAAPTAQEASKPMTLADAAKSFPNGPFGQPHIEASKPVQAEAPSNDADPLTPEQEEWVMDLAEKHNLGRRIGQIAAMRGKYPDVFYTDASYRTHELFCFAAELLATQPPAIPAAPAVQDSGEREHAENYRLIRRGQHWSVIDGMGNTLRGDDLDAAVDAIRANRAALASPPASGEKQG